VIVTGTVFQWVKLPEVSGSRGVSAVLAWPPVNPEAQCSRWGHSLQWPPLRWCRRFHGRIHKWWSPRVHLWPRYWCCHHQV